MLYVPEHHMAFRDRDAGLVVDYLCVSRSFMVYAYAFLPFCVSMAKAKSS